MAIFRPLYLMTLINIKLAILDAHGKKEEILILTFPSTIPSIHQDSNGVTLIIYAAFF
jgi:hypothetical protein